MRKYFNITNFLVVFIIFAAIFSSAFFLYSNYQRTIDVKKAQIAACERGLAKSLIVIDFMQQAAEIRRASAAVAENPIQAQNDLHAARTYEAQAKKFDELTPKDCQAVVSNPSG